MFIVKICIVDDVFFLFVKKLFNIYLNWNMLLDKFIRYKIIFYENLFCYFSWLFDMFF